MIGKYLIILGLVITVIGLVFLLAPKVPYLGRLPGDIYFKRDDFVFYLPLATSILISVILSLILYFFTRR